MLKYSFMSTLLILLTITIFSPTMSYNMIIEWEMYNHMGLPLTLLVYMDIMSVSFCILVLFISSLILLYSLSYMEESIHINRFIFSMITFITSMIIMISMPSTFSILIGWDGLGLSSFFLVLFYMNYASLNASVVTLLSNRIGDVFMIMIFWLSIFSMSWNLLLPNHYNQLLGALVLLSGITKSAQIPYSAWLPAAMAAPTPVSSLVHSSTLVTAGIYLMIRYSNFWCNSSMSMLILMLSFVTLCLASSSAMMSYDMKKIIAFSTLSQLSFMFMSCSLNFPQVAYFHLFTHATFKALLFMCAGMVMHSSYSSQDIRFISLSSFSSPILMFSLSVSTLSMCGIPFLSGFFSKDLAMELMLYYKYSTIFMNSILILVIMFTILYSIRLMFFVSSNPLFPLSSIHEPSSMMTSVFIFSWMSIISGSIMNWIMSPLIPPVVFSESKYTILTALGLTILITWMFPFIYINKIIFSNLWWLEFITKKFVPLKIEKNVNNFRIFEVGWVKMWFLSPKMPLLIPLSPPNFKFNFRLILYFTLISLIMIMSL